MKIGEYEIYAPIVAPVHDSESAMLGAAVWLWVHSPAHQKAPLISLGRLLLPLIKQQRYVIATREGQPCFFLSWGLLSEAVESAYIGGADESYLFNHLSSGDRLWIFDWIAPFGDTAKLATIVTREIFPHHCFRSLYHKGRRTGLRVKSFRGQHVTRQAAQQWQQSHPIKLGSAYE
ncbi:toxin-activating lysine-acyltransferase [Providencia rettgeri]